MRTTKPERREAKRLWRTECQRHGVNWVVRRLRDGWGPVRFTLLDAHGAPAQPPFETFGKVTYQ